MSITLPWRTSPTCPKPSPFSAWPMAFPCGSRTPFLRVTKTRAFMFTYMPTLPLREGRKIRRIFRGGENHRQQWLAPPRNSLRCASQISTLPQGEGRNLFHQHRSLGFALHRFGHDSQASCDFGIRLDDAAHIAAETVLVELLVGRHI